MMDGETRSPSPIFNASLQTTELGAVSRTEAEVAHVDCAPLAVVVQPTGRFGDVTLSKFSENTCATLSGKYLITALVTALPTRSSIDCPFVRYTFVPASTPLVIT